ISLSLKGSYGVAKKNIILCISVCLAVSFFAYTFGWYYANLPRQCVFKQIASYDPFNPASHEPLEKSLDLRIEKVENHCFSTFSSSCYFLQYVTNFLQSSNTGYSKNRLSGRARLSLSHTVLLSLTLLSKRISYRSVSSSFHLEKGNIHRIFFSFCEQVITQKDRLIQWPTGQEALQHLLPFSSWLSRSEGLEERGLPRVLGVLGHTRIPIRLPAGKPDSESDAPENEPHPDSWLNLELVCNDKGRFIYCHISKGSEKDRGSTLAERILQNPEMVPPGTCLIAGVGYPLTEQILTPFSAGRNPQENLFNRSVGSHLGRFNQAVADLKERFQKLRYLDMGNYDRAKAVVLTACILHNVFLDMGDVTKGLVESSTPEDVDEVNEDPAGVKMRETVVNLLYSTLEAAPQ
uniref:Elongin B n=1 Tax=Cyprinus carpio TaxID=7962 RepID=A0A8C1L5G3_CYPCA